MNNGDNENFKISDYDVALAKSLFQKETNKSDQNVSRNHFNSKVPYDRVELTTDHQTQVDDEEKELSTTMTSLTSKTTTNLPSSTRIYIIYKTNKFWNESNPINMLADSPCLMKFQAILKSKFE